MFALDERLAGDCVVVGALPLCQVLLMNDSQYPWLILVPRQANLREICQLDGVQQHQLLHESNLTSAILLRHFHAEKLNIGALGNIVSQLHIHHIARFASDPAWPRPVWGAHPAIPYTPAQRSQRLTLLQGAFRAAESKFVDAE